MTIIEADAQVFGRPLAYPMIAFLRAHGLVIAKLHKQVPFIIHSRLKAEFPSWSRSFDVLKVILACRNGKHQLAAVEIERVADCGSTVGQYNLFGLGSSISPLILKAFFTMAGALPDA